MWVTARERVVELHPDSKEEVITLAGGWPRAELRVERQGDTLLTYRYWRRLRHVIWDEDFPEHDLPAWLHRMWSNPDVDFKQAREDGGLHAVERWGA
jgi:hypothetical protein